MLVHHNKGVEVVFLMRQNNLTFLGGAKVVAAGLEGVPHHTITTCAPIERRGRCHTAIYPVVGVFNGNALALVAEASVLHTATIKVLARLCLERQCGAVLVKRHRCHALHNRFATLGVNHGHQASLLVKAHGNARCRNYHAVALVAQVNALCRAACVLHQYLCGRSGLRVAYHTTVVVAEEAEYVVAIKIYCQLLAISISHLNRGRVYFSHILNRVA